MEQMRWERLIIRNMAYEAILKKIILRVKVTRISLKMLAQQKSTYMFHHKEKWENMHKVMVGDFCLIVQFYKMCLHIYKYVWNIYHV